MKTRLPYILVAAVILFGCARSNVSDEPPPMKLRPIEDVLADHTPALMEIEGVVGTAQSELEDGTPSIMIMLLERTDALEESLPKELEGHPVMLHVSGEIRGLD